MEEEPVAVTPKELEEWPVTGEEPHVSPDEMRRGAIMHALNTAKQLRGKNKENHVVAVINGKEVSAGQALLAVVLGAAAVGTALAVHHRMRSREKK